MPRAQVNIDHVWIQLPNNEDPEVLFATAETGALDLSLYRLDPDTIRLNGCAGLVDATGQTNFSAGETVAMLKRVLNKEEDATWGVTKDQAIVLTGSPALGDNWRDAFGAVKSIGYHGY
jgi:hypothetical protein